MSNRKLKQTVLYRKENEKKNNITRAIKLFSVYVLFTQERSQENLTHCLFINYAYICMIMHASEMKFERNGSLEYYLLTCIDHSRKYHNIP